MAGAGIGRRLSRTPLAASSEYDNQDLAGNRERAIEFYALDY